MSEPWEDAVKAIGIKLNAAELELVAAKKDHATKAELVALKADINELVKELKALKSAGKPKKEGEPEPEPDAVVTPDPNDIASGYW